jgi:hypothetical protein
MKSITTKFEIEKIEEIRDQLKKQVAQNNGKRRTRTLSSSDVERFLKLVESNSDKSVQVRAEAVSNSYNYAAPSTYLRYNYATQNIQVGIKTFKVAGGDNGDSSVKKYNYGF